MADTPPSDPPPLPGPEADYWTERYAQGGAAAEHAGQSYVLVRLGGERFAVAMQDLDEVATVTTGIALPHLDPMVLGLANVRGELLPLLDTAALLGLNTAYRLGARNRTLVVRDQRGRRIGLPVDAVEAVEDLDPGAFQPRHAAPGGAPVRRVGVGEHKGQSLSLLDVTPLRQASFSHF
jgi:purine-binding chemotaxis protein CheW